MNANLFYVCGCVAFVIPYLAIAAILLHNRLRGARWSRSKYRRPPISARCSTSAAVAAMLLFAQVFYRPSIAHAVEERQQIDVDEDDSGDPEHPDRELDRQLKRIRRSEPVGNLILRL